MPIREEHLSRLKDELGTHERRAAHLTEQIASLRAELHAHKMIVQFGRHQKLLELLNKLYDRPDEAKAIAERPKAYAKEIGLVMPRGAKVRVLSEPTVEVSLAVVSEHYSFDVGWNREGGFFVRNIE